MAIVLTVDYANNNSLPNNNIFLYDTEGQIKGAMICLWVILGVSLIFLILDFNLVLFHLYLMKKGLTTFQYIVVTEDRKEQKRELVMKMHSKFTNKYKERARRILGERKAKKTCFDFVLCLKKKKKPRAAQKAPQNVEMQRELDIENGHQGIRKESNIELTEQEKSKTVPATRNVIEDTQQDEAAGESGGK